MVTHADATSSLVCSGRPRQESAIRGGYAPRSARGTPATPPGRRYARGQRVEHHLVEDAVPDLIFEPLDVSDVVVVDRGRQLGLERHERHDVARASFDDEVDLVLAAVDAEVRDLGCAGPDGTALMEQPNRAATPGIATRRPRPSYTRVGEPWLVARD